jgi:hypothetical protein
MSERSPAATPGPETLVARDELLYRLPLLLGQIHLNV